MLGYPGGGDFTATPARIRETIELSGPDIYNTTTVDREVYTIRGTVRQGNSGGPMVDRQVRCSAWCSAPPSTTQTPGSCSPPKEVGRQLARVGNTAARGDRRLRHLTAGP